MVLGEACGAWPVLTRYDSAHLDRLALPLGGIGTGTVSLGGRGELRDWEVVNRPAKGFIPTAQGCGPFFALWTRASGGEPITRALEGAMGPPYDGAFGVRLPNHGLPRFRHCAFAAAYPLGQVFLNDPTVPLDVRLEAWNPLVPTDSAASGLPLAVLRYVLRNPGPEAVAAAICGSLPNFVGTDGRGGRALRNRNTWRRGDSGLTGLLLASEGLDPADERWGTLVLAVLADGVTAVSGRTRWAELSWGDALLHFWDDFSADGALEEPEVGTPGDAPMASLSASVTVPAHAEVALTFLLTWHFPNRQTWSPSDSGPAAANRVGNYYTTQDADAWAVATRTARLLPALERETVAFVSAFCGTDLPAPIKEAALYNLSTLRSQTCFRTEDGRFYGFEGCGDDAGCCVGSCTHVWNYEAASSLLFGELARAMREVEFGHATDARGLMSFRVHLPLERAREFGKAAADGQMGTIMRLYRDWRWSGDDAWLRRLWPAAKRALAFAWVEGGWDADIDGVMEGCQHNTLDVEYYGPSPLMEGWYLGALRAAAEMARHVGEEAWAEHCEALAARGRAWVDAHLWNGAYYEQEVRAPRPGQAIAPGLRVGADGPAPADPPHQIGAGCLVDQLAGQCMAHVCGLGYLLDPAHVRAALQAVFRHNFREDLFGHFNHLRSFAVADEQGLVMCSFPRGGRPPRPTPYFNELMTGFEYTAAVHMLFEGQVEEGLRCIGAIRARYDGRRRSPFDEAECGHHYARAMASWSAVVALSGFLWSAVSGEMTLCGRVGRHFWSTGYAWGTCTLDEVVGASQSAAEAPSSAGRHVSLFVGGGRLPLRRLRLVGVGEVGVEGGPLMAGDVRSIVVPGS